MTNEEYWYWLCSIENITPAITARLLSVFQTPQEIFEASEGEIAMRTGLTDDSVSAISASRDADRVRAGLENVLRKGIRLVNRNDPEFPQRLNILKDVPLCLFVKGNLPQPDAPAAGMVGARALSGYGREYAKKYSSALALENIQIISGMALGIDSVCAKGAMDSGGKTFAVLGSGADVIYPRENIELYYEILTNGGGIISEYLPGAAPLAWHFPHRNRLIAALSDILIVIEAGKRSGTLSTAMHALDLGKDVWALPGRVNDRMSEGCNDLIKDGAGMLTDITEVIDALKMPCEHEMRIYEDYLCADGQPLSDKQRIFDLIGYEPADTDDIILKSGISPDRVFRLLAELELEGMICHISGTFYARN